jgi:hypothetical protein
MKIFDMIREGHLRVTANTVQFGGKVFVMRDNYKID